MAKLIQVRRDTAAGWTAVNPILSSGEPAFVTDTGEFKIGDGATSFNALTPFRKAGLFSGVKATKIAAQAVPTGVFTAITFPTEDYDTSGYHDLVVNTNRITVPAGKAGYYFMSVTVDWQAAAGGTTRAIQMKVNNGANALAVQYLGVGGSDVTNSLAVPVNLAVGDYVEVLGYQDTAGNLNVGGLGAAQPMFFSASLLGV